MKDFAAYDPYNLLVGGISNRFYEMGEKAGIDLDRKTWRGDRGFQRRRNA